MYKVMRFHDLVLTQGNLHGSKQQSVREGNLIAHIGVVD